MRENRLQLYAARRPPECRSTTAASDEGVKASPLPGPPTSPLQARQVYARRTIDVRHGTIKRAPADRLQIQRRPRPILTTGQHVGAACISPCVAPANARPTDAAKSARRPSRLRQRSSGFFSRSGRNSVSGDRPLDSRAGPPAPLLDVLPSTSTALTDDKSLSQYLVSQRTPTIQENPGHVSNDVGKPVLPSSASQFSRSATMLSRQSNETSAPSDYQYQSTILTLQTKIMTESHEKEAILAKYSSLAKVHEAQRDELTAAQTSLKKLRAGGANSIPAQPSAPTLLPASPPVATPAPTVQPVVPADAQKFDAVWQQELQALITDLHKWVFVHFNDSEIDFTKLSSEDKSVVERILPPGVAPSDVPKTALLQALATSSFLNVFQDPFFPALPSKYESLKASHDLLKSAAPSAAYAQWRAATVAALLASDDPSLKESTEEYVEHVVKGTDDILGQLTSSEKPEARHEELRQIIASAVNLARKVKTEKVDFDFHLPVDPATKSLAFDGDLMDDVTAKSGSNSSKIVQVVLSPVVYRLASDVAEGQEAKSVILKAKVVCKA
ncbi:hypothetical protein FH972_022445 [Carpinus fangiana]|uniref:Uncharacterized protein n=1 Tax=Carpinus fangiana TaxID=176857 RepID=A0A5N6KSA1_9ROSI|nr:hypothetical protein FH972_022445 [Carpinus fangiana]